MKCPGATGKVLSSETIPPISFRFGYDRAEYTVGVSGCGERKSYVVIRPDNGYSSCFAGGSRVDD